MFTQEKIREFITNNQCCLCEGVLKIEMATSFYMRADYYVCQQCGFFFADWFKHEKPAWVSDEEFDFQKLIDSYLDKLNTKVLAGIDAQTKLNFINSKK